ncbi:heterokaryon incompatibility protein-domain-containing protein [Lanmaoa asiatica]|nr:heterokaryon incompatibility protein-domain-containing protein [Lanmaoa asiatica]
MATSWRDVLCTYVSGNIPDQPSHPTSKPIRLSPPFKPFPAIEGSTQALCERCSQLDALSRIASHRPFVLEDLDDDRSKMATRKTTQIPSLGPIRSLRLLSTCPLCRLIFDASYLADEEMEIVRSGGELVVVTGWTIHRLEQELYWKGCERGRGPYAKCIYTSVTTWSLEDGIYEPERLVEEAMEAIGLIDVGESQPNNASALGVRQVEPQDPQLPHDETLASSGLKQIKLIDVETRQIIMYPPDGCDYIALSYVWGGVEQPSYRLGEILPTVPATLEDAMAVTRNLGKQYLWADSLCIDQGNDAEKAVEIALMSAIYSGAWATIVSLSGRSARSGLPRVGTLQGVVPQLSCEISRGHPGCLERGPYQEGLLSPRRLFFTNHQVYFECNSIQCCESLDDSNSPFHLLSDEERRAALDDVVQDPNKSSEAGPEGVIGRGVLRDPFRPILSTVEAQIDADDFARYLRLVHAYTMKKISHDADSLNAFSAMLTRLADNYYKRGFVQGLPVEDLPRALLWFHPSPPRRRVDFPTWSWAGWEGGVSDIEIHGAEDSYDAIMPPLRIWKAGYDDHPELIYNYNPTPHIIKELEVPPGEENDSQDDVTDDDDDSDSWEDSGL